MSYRPHAKNSLLGLMTKMGALGIFSAGPVYLYNIGNEIPSMYPTCDLFLAPIFASISKIIDEVSGVLFTRYTIPTCLHFDIVSETH